MEVAMRALVVPFAVAALLVSFTAPLSAQALKLPRAEGICHHWGTELVSPATTCVSSHLPAQGANDYGPDMLTTDQAAWCVAAPAIGQWVRDGYAEPIKISRILITNGYAKSAETFRNNGRVKRVAVETSDGVKMSFDLKDRREFQEIRLPRVARARWVQITIEEIYPGARSSDVCLSEVGVDLEEFNRN
jgi:hypothetical protein